MSSIRITAIPPGFAPEEIRAQWVGVEIPLATEEEIREDPPSGFSIGSQNKDGHYVLTSKAVEALERAGKDGAADYWGSMPLGRYLRFKKEACEQVA